MCYFGFFRCCYVDFLLSGCKIKQMFDKIKQLFKLIFSKLNFTIFLCSFYCSNQSDENC